MPSFDMCFIAPSAVIVGDVVLAPDCCVLHHAVLRADFGRILIGRGSNLQDHVVVHMSPGTEVRIGHGVSVGHGAILHGCEVGDQSLIGMGAIVMNGVKIGRRSIVAAGSRVLAGEFPDDSLIVDGIVKRATHARDWQLIQDNAAHYQRLCAELRAGPSNPTDRAGAMPAGEPS